MTLTTMDAYYARQVVIGRKPEWYVYQGNRVALGPFTGSPDNRREVAERKATEMNDALKTENGPPPEDEDARERDRGQTLRWIDRDIAAIIRHVRAKARSLRDEAQSIVDVIDRDINDARPQRGAIASKTDTIVTELAKLDTLREVKEHLLSEGVTDGAQT